MTSWAAYICAALLVLPMAAAAADGAPQEWKFQVLLDDKPVGDHVFSVAVQGDQTVVRSVARFDIKLLFITAYTYRHEATERWRSGCLEGVYARTDDNGKLSTVQAQARGEVFDVVATTAGTAALEGCVMSFAYWNPALLSRKRMLNLQTGKYENVQVKFAGDDQVQVLGQPVAARKYRVVGAENPIDLWYAAADQRWLALQSTVAGGRTLRYQLTQ